jgi:hypothetical protein
MENMYTLYGQNVKDCKDLEGMQLLVNISYAWKICNFWKIYNIFNDKRLRIYLTFDELLTLKSLSHFHNHFIFIQSLLLEF